MHNFMQMQPNSSARKEYDDIVNDTPTLVHIPGTKKKVKLTGMKPYTIERLTMLWSEREMSITKDAPATLKSLCREPYFSVKEACLMVSNSYLKIIFIYPVKWRIWAYLKGYTEDQMTPIIMEGKKKLPLMGHWQNMAFSVDMRTDWMKMTAKEAEQYRAELLSAANQLSSRSTPATEERKAFSVGSLK
ncbi:MAG: hypothetical protein MJY83_04990 [Bacteroidales bacterium]|nr:hypothetical protein [Bacteroidales bacterium]